jgi:hypothetical protein
LDTHFLDQALESYRAKMGDLRPWDLLRPSVQSGIMLAAQDLKKNVSLTPLTVEEVMNRSTTVTTSLGSVVGTSTWRLVMKIATTLLAALVLASFAGAQTVTVPQGTSIRLRLSQDVSSADSHVGDPVSMEVLDDVQFGNATAIRRGAQAHGIITEAHGKGRMGRAGAVALRVDYVAAADGTRLLVSAERKQKGSNSAGTITTGIVVSSVLFVPIAPLWLLKKGKDTDIPAGTPLQVFTTGDTQVDMSLVPAPVHAPVRAAVAPPSQEHVIEGYTLSGPDTSSVDGNSLGDAARRARAKKTSEVK